MPLRTRIYFPKKNKLSADWSRCNWQAGLYASWSDRKTPSGFSAACFRPRDDAAQRVGVWTPKPRTKSTACLNSCNALWRRPVNHRNPSRSLLNLLLRPPATRARIFLRGGGDCLYSTCGHQRAARRDRARYRIAGNDMLRNGDTFNVWYLGYALFKCPSAGPTDRHRQPLRPPGFPACLVFFMLLYRFLHRLRIAFWA